MTLFRNKAKRGEGTHPDLQYQPKLKNLNGIEALIGALGARKLNETNLNIVAKELPILAYRIAVLGTLTFELSPDKAAAKWHESRSRCVIPQSSLPRQRGTRMLRPLCRLP